VSVGLPAAVGGLFGRGGDRAKLRQSTCSQCRLKEPKVSRAVRRRGRHSRAGVATDGDRSSHEREDGGAMTETETEVRFDRSPEFARWELAGPRSSPGSEATVTARAPDSGGSEPINLGARGEDSGGFVRLPDVNKRTRDGSTDRRLSSGPAVALRSHGRPEDMPTSHLETRAWIAENRMWASDERSFRRLR
jgi:hypothetical protein